MADTALDDVRIEIDASAEKAKDSINKLIDNLEALREARRQVGYQTCVIRKNTDIALGSADDYL